MAKLPFKINSKHFLLIALIIIFASVGTCLFFSSKAASTLSADFNSDNTVNIFDLSILASNWGESNATKAMGDANSDGVVNIFDLSTLASQWGQTATPTPTGQPANSINVKDYGAKGDGVTDDTANLKVAFNTAVTQGKIAWVPAGTYRISNLIVPDGVKITGVNMSQSWLKGNTIFGSNQEFSNLKFGDSGFSTSNRNGATNTMFTNCHFRGGGGDRLSVNAPVIMIGLGQNSASHISFIDSEIERNMGTQPTYPATSENLLPWNNISITEGPGINGAHIDNILFKNCHIGVSNSRTDIPRNIGSPAAALEATTPGDGNTLLHGYSNITLVDNIFEAADIFGVDFSDGYLYGTTERAAGPITMTGNLFMGGGWDGGVWGYTLMLECPKNVLIEKNTFYRGHEQTIAFGNGEMSGKVHNAVIRNNTFRLDYDNGIPSSNSDMFTFKGGGMVFTDNTIAVNSGGNILDFWDAFDATVTGNYIEDYRTDGAVYFYQFVDTLNTTMINNTFKTHSDQNPLFYIASGNYRNTYSPNTFIHN